MFWKKSLAVGTLAFLLFVAACSPKSEPAGQESTAAIETQFAQFIASTENAKTSIANDVASTLTAMVTSASESNVTSYFTSTPLFTPTTEPTLTSGIPLVSVSEQTNCRLGPGTSYDAVGYFMLGQTAEVVGRSASNDYWVIKLPSDTSITCWVWAKYSTVVGNTTDVPIIRAPATPTPLVWPTGTSIPMSFTADYSSTTTCSGSYYLRFEIYNDGVYTLESISINAKDQSTGEEHSVTSDSFKDYEGCSLSHSDQNLEEGESGIATSGGFSSNPNGHNIKVTIRICNEDDMDEPCVKKTFTVTP